MKELLSKFSLKKPYKLMLPAIITLYSLIGIGVFSAVAETLEHFDQSIQLFSSSDFYLSLGLSLRLAVLSTGTALVIAIGILYGLYCLTLFTSSENKQSTLLSESFNRLFQAPMLVPYIVAGYLVFLTFGQSGLVSRLMYALGIINEISEFPILVNDPLGYGIVIAFVWKTMPFMVLMLYPAMLSLDNKYLEMARLFGLNPSKYFFQILIPHMAPTIAFSSFIVFAYTLTSFEIPYMLGATYPKTIAVSAYQMYTGGTLDQRHAALTMSLVLFILSLTLGILAFKHASAYQKHLKGGDD